MPRFTKETARLASRKGNIARWSPATARRFDPGSTAMETLEAESRWVKRGLSGEIRSQVLLLQETPCRTLAKLGNTPDGEGRASLVARITDTAAKVYGWDSDKSNVMVLVNMTEALDPDKAAPIVDVQEIPSPS